MVKGIEKVVKKFCVQTCVYWGSPTSDGYGGYTYATPVEKYCRWENKTEIKLGADGQTYSSQSQVLFYEDIEVNGYLWLGSLTELSTLEGNDSTVDSSNPKTIPHASIIVQVDKIPMVFKTDEFVRTAYLYDYGK